MFTQGNLFNTRSSVVNEGPVNLKKILGINWKRNIANKDLYTKTKYESWSQEIRARRLAWLGHLMGLNSETPERKALEEHPRKMKGQKRPGYIQ